MYRCMRREAYRPIVSLLRSPEAHYTRRVVISAKEVMRSRQFVCVCVCVRVCVRVRVQWKISHIPQLLGMMGMILDRDH